MNSSAVIVGSLYFSRSSTDDNYGNSDIDAFAHMPFCQSLNEMPSTIDSQSLVGMDPGQSLRYLLHVSKNHEVTYFNDKEYLYAAAAPLRFSGYSCLNFKIYNTLVLAMPV